MDDEVVIVDAAGTEHVFPAGTDPQRAAAIVRGQSAPQTPLQQKLEARYPGVVAKLREAEQDTPRPVDTGAPIGAQVGGMLGGRFGWPGVIVGSGVGGAVGEGVEQLGNLVTGRPVPASLTDSAQRIATAGGTQAAMAAGSLGLGKGIKQLGKAVYSFALSPKPTLVKDFKNVDIPAVGLRERLMPTRSGAATAKARTGAARNVADASVADAAARGVPPLTAFGSLNKMAPVMEKVRAQRALGLPDETPAVLDRAKAFMAQNRGGIPLTSATALKREAQDLSNPAYVADRLRKPITDVDLAFNKAQATGLQSGLEQRVPGLASKNARTQELMALTAALEDARDSNRVIPRLVAGLGGSMAAGMAGMDPLSALGTAAAGATLMSPTTLSALGISLDRTGRVIVQSGPTLLRALQLLMSDDSTEAR